MDHANITFIAKVKTSNQRPVIKLVTGYGVEAHELLAGEGMASRLLHCGPRIAGMRSGTTGVVPRAPLKLAAYTSVPFHLVVMDYIEGNTVDKTTPLREDTHTQIEKATRTLRQVPRHVFGDLRELNIAIPGSRVFLIDFDWVGKVDEARYPRDLSRSAVAGKRGSVGVEAILIEHEQFTLNQISRLLSLRS